MSVLEEQPIRKRRSFTKELKADAVAMVLDEGRTIADVARSLGIGATSLGNWVRQARIDRGEREGLTTGEREEHGMRPCWPRYVVAWSTMTATTRKTSRIMDVHAVPRTDPPSDWRPPPRTTNRAATAAR